MNFNNKVLWVIKLFGVDVWITESIFNTWIIMLLLIIFAIIVRIKLTGFKKIPAGFQNAIEIMVESFDNIVKSAAGEKYMGLGNWFFMTFAFILVSNISGIFGLRPPTADWATAFAFSLATFIIIQFMGIKHRKGKYLKSFFEPVFIFFPLNLIGEIARPISLSFRLFGNVLAGMILISMVYSLPIYLQIAIPTVFNAVFDLAFGALQTYIFCILSLTFIRGAAEGQ